MAQPQPTFTDYEPPQNCLILTRYFYPPSERSDGDLRLQLEQADKMVSEIVVRPLQSHQRDALLCLASDLVAGLTSSAIPFERSFLISALNKGMFQVAAAEFNIFCYVQGRVQPRAWEKRHAEQYLFVRGRLWFD